MKKIIVLGCMLGFLFANNVDENFSNTKINKLPHNWLTNSENECKVIKDGQNNVLFIDKSDSFDILGFNTCYEHQNKFKNLKASVRFKAISGFMDQGGGIMTRVLDSKNYNIVRFNPLEDNITFYRVKDGTRSLIASAKVKLSKDWHTMSVIFINNHFQAFLDGKKYIDTKDDTFLDAGYVGVWSKADASTYFDDFRVESIKK